MIVPNTTPKGGKRRHCKNCQRHKCMIHKMKGGVSSTMSVSDLYKKNSSSASASDMGLNDLYKENSGMGASEGGRRRRKRTNKRRRSSRKNKRRNTRRRR